MTANNTNSKGTAMTSQKRAKQGGEIGKNGEFYAGGTFLPSTTLTKMTRTVAKGSRKVEIEPYVWVASEGRRSLYDLLAGKVGVMSREGKFAPNNATAIGYLGYTQQQAQELCDRYNNGDRWL